MRCPQITHANLLREITPGLASMGRGRFSPMCAGSRQPAGASRRPLGMGHAVLTTVGPAVVLLSLCEITMRHVRPKRHLISWRSSIA